MILTTAEHDHASERFAIAERGSFAGGPSQLLRDAPEYGSFPPHVLRFLGWCFRYHEETPSRDDIARAVVALATMAIRRK